MRATELLKEDHRRVHDMFRELESLGADDASRRQQLFERIVEELDVHAEAEEQTFYPAARAASRRIDDAVAGHQHLRSVIAHARDAEPGSEEFRDLVHLVKQVVLAHVLEEESGIFLDAERLGAAELERLGAELEQRKQAGRARARKIA